MFDEFFIPAKDVHSHNTRSLSKGNIYLSLAKRSIDYSRLISFGMNYHNIREHSLNSPMIDLKKIHLITSYRHSVTLLDPDIVSNFICLLLFIIFS